MFMFVQKTLSFDLKYNTKQFKTETKTFWHLTHYHNNAEHFERINVKSQYLYNCVTAKSYSALLRQVIKKKEHTHWQQQCRKTRYKAIVRNR